MIYTLNTCEAHILRINVKIHVFKPYSVRYMLFACEKISTLLMRLRTFHSKNTYILSAASKLKFTCFLTFWPSINPAVGLLRVQAFSILVRCQCRRIGALLQ